MTERFVLWGADCSASREVMAYLRKHKRAPVAFTDNDPKKWGTSCEGIPVFSPDEAVSKFPFATFVAVLQTGKARAIRQQIRSIGLKVGKLSDYSEVHRELPSPAVQDQLWDILEDIETKIEFCDQVLFRQKLDYEAQAFPSDSSQMYFPPFISKNPAEVYVDCGAYDGDTIKQFLATRQARRIFAFEPDKFNFAKLPPGITKCNYAVTDCDGVVPFLETRNNVSHIESGAPQIAICIKLDSVPWNDDQPTFIKMDIEGAEMAALRGGQTIIQKYRPVLAVCAYHKAADLWEIPLLIHSFVPSYDLRLRRYGEGSMDLVWYAIPPERIGI